MANMFGRIPSASYDRIKPIFETRDKKRFEEILASDPFFKDDPEYVAFWIATVARDFRWEEKPVEELFLEMCKGLGLDMPAAIPPEKHMRESLARNGVRV